MINFTRKGTQVIAEIETDIEIAARCFNLGYTCSDEVYACLLVRNWEKKLRSSLQEIRRRAYDEGWKDSKAKTAKQTWFAGGWL